jgi:hypothetical protein
VFRSGRRLAAGLQLVSRMYRSDTYALVARRRALEVELEQARRQEAERRSRSLKLLERVVVESPCRARWSRMTPHPSDLRVRLCQACQKGVYDLAAFEADEIEALLEREGTDLCARIYRRPDGTIMTAACARAVRIFETGRNVGGVGGIVVRLCILLLTTVAAIAAWNREPRTMGGISFRSPGEASPPPPPSEGAGETLG